MKKNLFLNVAKKLTALSLAGAVAGCALPPEYGEQSRDLPPTPTATTAKTATTATTPAKQPQFYISPQNGFFNPETDSYFVPPVQYFDLANRIYIVPESSWSWGERPEYRYRYNGVDEWRRSPHEGWSLGRFSWGHVESGHVNKYNNDYRRPEFYGGSVTHGHNNGKVWPRYHR